jgi:hypothetical protein
MRRRKGIRLSSLGNRSARLVGGGQPGKQCKSASAATAQLCAAYRPEPAASPAAATAAERTAVGVPGKDPLEPRVGGVLGVLAGG